MNYVGNKWLNLPWKGRLATKHYPQLKIKKEYERIRKQLDEKMGIGKRKNRLPC